MSGAPVLLTIDGDIATITLNRPRAGNTIDMALARALVDASIRCADDPAIRCVVLTGAGRLFCGGGDIAAFAGAGDGASAFLVELADTLHDAVARLMRMPKPLLTLINGPAAGGGLSLALIGDVAIAARSAHFTAAYGSVGLTPDGGMSWLLPRLIGLRRAQEMILTNRRVSADDAATIGLVTRTVDDAALADEGARTARLMADGPTGATGAARALLLDSGHAPLETHLARESRSIGAAGAAAESREGIAAFMARRPPDFAGAA